MNRAQDEELRVLVDTYAALREHHRKAVADRAPGPVCRDLREEVERAACMTCDFLADVVGGWRA